MPDAVTLKTFFWTSSAVQTQAIDVIQHSILLRIRESAAFNHCIEKLASFPVVTIGRLTIPKDKKIR